MYHSAVLCCLDVQAKVGERGGLFFPTTRETHWALCATAHFGGDFASRLQSPDAGCSSDMIIDTDASYLLHTYIRSTYVLRTYITPYASSDIHKRLANAYVGMYVPIKIAKF